MEVGDLWITRSGEIVTILGNGSKHAQHNILYKVKQGPNRGKTRTVDKYGHHRHDSNFNLQRKVENNLTPSVGEYWLDREGHIWYVSDIDPQNVELILENDEEETRWLDGWCDLIEKNDSDLISLSSKEDHDELYGESGEVNQSTLEQTLIKGEEMENNILSNVLNSMSEAGREGAKDGAASAAMVKATQILKKKLGKSYPAFFKTEIGKIVESALVPALLMSASEAFPQLPHSETIKDVAAHALRGSVSKNTDEAITALLPLFEGVGAVIEKAS